MPPRFLQTRIPSQAHLEADSIDLNEIRKSLAANRKSFHGRAAETRGSRIPIGLNNREIHHANENLFVVRHRVASF